jgi:hypothetical protein
MSLGIPPPILDYHPTCDRNCSPSIHSTTDRAYAFYSKRVGLSSGINFNISIEVITSNFSKPNYGSKKKSKDRKNIIFLT